MDLPTPESPTRKELSDFSPHVVPRRLSDTTIESQPTEITQLFSGRTLRFSKLLARRKNLVREDQALARGGSVKGSSTFVLVKYWLNADGQTAEPTTYRKL